MSNSVDKAFAEYGKRLESPLQRREQVFRAGYKYGHSDGLVEMTGQMIASISDGGAILVNATPGKPLVLSVAEGRKGFSAVDLDA